MIAHILRLTIGEWLKIRRRWMPWALLGIIVVATQGILWGSYADHHLSDDSLPPYEFSDAEGSIVVTCEEAVEGRADEKLALVAGRVTGEEREMIEAQTAGWLRICEGYQTPDEARSAFTLPDSIGAATSAILLPLYLIPIMILAASVMGIDYGLGTLRTTLARGVGRWQLLSGKLTMLLGVAIAWVIIIGVIVGIASLIAGVVPPAEKGSLVAGEAGAWLNAVEGMAKLVFALAPYVALGVFVAVLTQSTALGITLSMGHYILELILFEILGGVADWLATVMEVVFLSQNGTEWLTTTDRTVAQQALGTVVEQPDTLRAFFMLLAYTVVLVAATMWVFQRRDVAGARGE